MSEGETVLAAALGASALTGVFTVGGILMAQRLGQQATIASERRRIRVEERRQAVAPIRAFLEKAARARGRRFVEEIAASAYDENTGGLQQLGTREEIVGIISRNAEEEPSVQELGREAIAAMGSAPTRLLSFSVSAVTGLAFRKEEPATKHLRLMIHATRRLVEDYVVGGLEDGDEKLE